MSREVVVRARRPIGFEAFADLTDAPLLRLSPLPDGLTCLLFDDALTDEEAAAVWLRATSTSATDECNRATLRGAVAAEATNLAVLLTAYVLGDPLPEPVLPEPPLDPTE